MSNDISYASYTTLDMEPEEAFSEVEEAGFDGFEILSEGPHDLRTEEVREKFADADTALDLTVHAPVSDMNLGSLNDRIWEVVVSETRRVVEGAAEVGAERVTIHPGHYAPIAKRYPEEAEERNVEGFRRLGEAGEEFGVEVSVENLGSIDIFMGREASDVFDIAERAGVDVTWDVGHSYLSDELENFSGEPGRIDHVHIHDNCGECDDHMEIGEGEIPFDELNGFFDSYDGRFVVEGRSLEEGERSLLQLGEMLG